MVLLGNILVDGIPAQIRSRRICIYPMGPSVNLCRYDRLTALPRGEGVSHYKATAFGVTRSLEARCAPEYLVGPGRLFRPQLQSTH